MLLALVSLTLTEPVLSDNSFSVPVGFVRVQLVGQGTELASLPFLPLSDPTEGVLASGDLLVRQWDAANQEYVADGEASAPGHGFVIQNADTDPATVILCGQVVLDSTAASDLYPGLNLLGYPYSTRAEAPALPPTAGVSPVGPLEPGLGYWYQSDGTEISQWIESRPYADAFPDNAEPPTVVAMSAGKGANNMCLTIACTGVAGEQLDILYQDLTQGEAFSSKQGWQLADTVATVGQYLVAWTDAPGDNSARLPVNEVVGRYYLIGRADIDTDADGIPDARETFIHGTKAHNADTDGDGMPDGTELACGHDPCVADASLAYKDAAAPAAVSGQGAIYVDATTGRDTYDGRSETVAGTSGPKKTIDGGLAVSTAGDRIVVKSGAYAARTLPRHVTVLLTGNITLR